MSTTASSNQQTLHARKFVHSIHGPERVVSCASTFYKSEHVLHLAYLQCIRDKDSRLLAGGKAHSSKVLHLQFVCKRATIKIPPNTYRGDPSEQELAGRLEALLDKYGLSKKSGEREITKTKSRLQTERELEGEGYLCIASC